MRPERCVLQNPAQPVVLITAGEGLIGDSIVNWEYPKCDIASYDNVRPHKGPELQDFINGDLNSGESVNAAFQ